MALQAPSFSSRPLLSREAVAGEAVFVAALQAATGLASRFDELFRQNGLTSAQYNALRLLREAGEAGLMCNRVSQGLLSRDPDVTRLADRLDERGLITKARCSEDRRVITLRITPAGLSLLQDLDEPVGALHAQNLATLDNEEQKELLRLLQKLARGGPKTEAKADRTPS